MKREADGEEAVVLVPPALEDVEVQVPLGAVPIEADDVPIAEAVPPGRSYRTPSRAPSFECSRDCIVFGASKPLSILYQVASFLRNAEGTLA